MSCLLDTHVVLWLLQGSQHLGPSTRDWLGKLTTPAALPDLVDGSGLHLMSTEPRHAWGITEISGLPHRDPFDRLLVTQAHLEGLTLVTADQALLAAALAPAVPRLDARQ